MQSENRRMMARGFWSGLFGYQTPIERFSLEELRHLHTILLENANLNSKSSQSEQDTANVVEALRALSELMIWGDQHDPRFFEYFLENKLMSFFSGFLQKPSNRRGQVAQQVLQTLYMLIHNIKKETSLYYIFSNDHINDIVTLSFDFEEDEVLGYYINLLKTISLRLTPKIVQLFFQVDETRTAFPLYTEAIKLINHREGMVRAAVRTLTLNVYKLEDEKIRDFLVSEPASNFFNELAIIISEQCQILDRKLSSLEAGTSQAAYSVETELNGLEDLVSYCNDILNTGESRLVNLTLKSLWEGCIEPMLINTLQSLASPKIASSRGILPLTSLCILERMFSVMSHPRLTNSLACSLLIPTREDRPSNNKSVRWQPNGSCRAGFLEALTCGDTVLATAAVQVIAALMQNVYLDPEILDACGLLSQARRKKRDLINKLTSGMSFNEDGTPRENNTASIRESFSSVRRQSLDVKSSGWLANLQSLSSSGDVIWEEALYGLLEIQLLPCTALWLLGHILAQLSSVPGQGSSPSTRAILKSAYAAAQQRFLEELDSIWSDAVPILITHEWPRPFQEMKAFASLTASTVVQSWMQAIQNQKVALDGGPENTKGQSAHKAAALIQIVQAYISVYQIRQALTSGVTGPIPLPIVPAVESVMKKQDVREGTQLTLNDAITCNVAFSPGSETTVMFAVHGIPQVSWTMNVDANTRPACIVDSQPSLTKEERSAIVSSCPVVVLAKPMANSGTGSVLSTAPLVGASCHVDKNHPKWLHVHVRPQSRALIKAVKGSKPGEKVPQLERHIVDGHWVLAFPTRESALAASNLVASRAVFMKALIRESLSPLL